MIFTQSLSFFYIIIFIVAYNVASFTLNNKNVSNVLLIIGSIIILSTITSLESLGILCSVSILFFYWGKALNKAQKFKKINLGIAISVLIILFVIRSYEIADLALLHRIGLSYILFRLIHYLIESSRGTIKQYNPISFINYILFFPNFIAGPIDEYNNYNYWISHKHNQYKLILIKAGLFRLSLGIIKKFLLVPIIVNYSLTFSLFEGNFVWQEGLLISAFLYSFYILLDFSGYSDIAIGTAYLIGIKTPENFDNPYFSNNLSKFWKKWHMTFSNFLFKYVFKPLVNFLNAQFKKAPRLFISSIGYILTFIICGIWHGNSLNFIYWGMWHGIGLIIYKLWDSYVYKKRIKQKLLLAIYNAGAIIITFIYVTFGWFFFSYQSNDIHMILTHITNDDSDHIQVSTVMYQNNKYFQLEFSENDAPFIDIQLRSTAADTTLFFETIKSNPDNIYFINPEDLDKNLYLISVRSIYTEKKSPWYSTLSYLDTRNIDQSYLETYLFPEPNSASILDEKPKDLIQQELLLPTEISNQTITSEAIYIDNYGWAIMLHYKPHDTFKIKIDYKFNEGEWINYFEDREGIYDFAHIHGYTTHNGTNRNLNPGHYETRLMYYDSLRTGKWFYSDVEIPNYVTSDSLNSIISAPGTSKEK